MKIDHPSEEKLRLLQQGKLFGTESVDLLLHVSDCDICFQNLPQMAPEEFFDLAFPPEEDSEGKD